MPIVELQLLEDDPPAKVTQEDLQQLSDALGELFSSPIGGCWLKLSYLPRNQYAENGGRDDSDRSVFVDVLKAKLEAHEKLSIEADHIANLVAQHLHRDAVNVHVLYLPEAHGRIAFGGKLRSIDK